MSEWTPATRERERDSHSDPLAHARGYVFPGSHERERMEADDAGKGRALRAKIRSLTLAATFFRVAMSVSEWRRMTRKKDAALRAKIRSLTLAATFSG